jgi:hypothetical protein
MRGVSQVVNPPADGARGLYTFGYRTFRFLKRVGAGGRKLALGLSLLARSISGMSPSTSHFLLDSPPPLALPWTYNPKRTSVDNI